MGSLRNRKFPLIQGYLSFPFTAQWQNPGSPTRSEMHSLSFLFLWNIIEALHYHSRSWLIVQLWSNNKKYFHWCRFFTLEGRSKSMSWYLLYQLGKLSHHDACSQECQHQRHHHHKLWYPPCARQKVMSSFNLEKWLRGECEVQGLFYTMLSKAMAGTSQSGKNSRGLLPVILCLFWLCKTEHCNIRG